MSIKIKYNLESFKQQTTYHNLHLEYGFNQRICKHNNERTVSQIRKILTKWWLKTTLIQTIYTYI